MHWAKMMAIGFLGALPALSGCGVGSSVGAVNVTGTVTFDGKPLEGATISFVPDGEGGRNASGLTDASGNFRLTSVEPGDGALPGKYKITVSKMNEDNTPELPKSQEEAMKQVQERMKAAGGGATNPANFPKITVKETLPARYSNPGTSGLQAEVKASGENKFTFALTTSG